MPRKKSAHVPPKGLTQDAERFWREIAGRWTLNSETTELLNIAAQGKARAERLRLVLEADGMIVRSRAGAVPRPHPGLKALKEAEDTVIRAMRAMGLE
jgi:hypothetical protein